MAVLFGEVRNVFVRDGDGVAQLVSKAAESRPEHDSDTRAQRHARQYELRSFFARERSRL